MIALFKQKAPANIVILLVFGMLIKMPLFLNPRVIEPSTRDGKLYEFIVSLLSTSGQSNGFAAAILCFLLLYSQALMVNFLVNDQRLTSKPSFLPAMSYLMITSLFPGWNFLSAPLMSSLFIIWAFIKLFRLYNLNTVSGAIYNIGLLLGISSMIYFPSIAYLLCILMGLLILGPFRFNDALLLVIGILTPYYFYAVSLFLNDNFHVQNLVPTVFFHYLQLKNSIWMAGAVALMGVPFLIGGYYVQNHLRKMLIQARKNWSILLLYLLLSLLIPFISDSDSIQNWLMTAAPFAAFHACAYLYPQKPALPLFLFFIALAFIVFEQYGLHLWQV